MTYRDIEHIRRQWRDIEHLRSIGYHANFYWDIDVIHAAIRWYLGKEEKKG